MANKNKTNISKKMIPVIVFAIMLYTIASFVLQFFTSVEISPTLTTAYFAFWTVEIISLAGIKTVKVKGEKQEIREVLETENEELESESEE